MKERSLKELFHLIKKALPEEPEPLLTLSPETFVSDALSQMSKRNFSQVPVVTGAQVLGVFSYRSFALGLLKLPEKSRNQVLSLSVDDFLEDLKYAQVYDELSSIIEELNIKDAVLVGLENRLQGVITTIDALRYFYRVASPYVMLLEVELAIRELIRECVSQNELNVCIERCLASYYAKAGSSAPNCLEEMTLHDYVTMVICKQNWDIFSRVFGGNRHIAQAKLEPMADLRNVVFHFKRGLTAEEYDLMRNTRDWLLKKVKKLDATRKSNGNE